ncbi:MAG: hypothetical protein AMXMBFR58_21040 [Phycisphaerae bacterium]
MILNLVRLVCILLAASAARAGVTFTVTFDPRVRAELATGRLVVMLVKEGAKIPRSSQPLDGPFWTDPQPMYGIDVKELKPNTAVMIDSTATSFPCSIDQLPEGQYRAQARLDVSRGNSNWKRDAGNLYSEVVAFTVGAEPSTVAIVLNKKTTGEKTPGRKGVELFTLESKLLSEFHGRPITLRAAVAFPVSYNPARSYAAVYEVPGYGGDHLVGFQRDRSSVIPGSADEVLAQATFWVNVDPESPNGHTLFADSANNGPWAKALTTELIPAIEARYRLVAKPEARLLRGHSSGGWSTLWLALNYPEVFGATWSSSPDPVDFRKFQVVDLYGQPNFYYDASGKEGDPAAELSSYSVKSGTKMTIRQENLMEEVIGPGNSSAQQWDSWFAVFGPRDEAGRPAALFDAVTGKIDPAIAEQYRAYDIGHLLRTSPDKYLPVFRERVRLIVGGEDNFSLDEAVTLLAADLEKLGGLPGPGYVKIVPGTDHGTVMTSDAGRRIPREMVEHLKGAGLVK